MNRREFVAGIGSAATRPMMAKAQQTAMPVLGVLSSATFEEMSALLTPFYQGLAGEGYIENRNFMVQLRWADDNYDRLPALVADLVRRRVNLVVVMGSTPGALAAKAASQTIPIVFLVGNDPVEVGLVPSLARPGGNVTGVTTIAVELMAKRLSLMHELLPAASPIAVLFNPANRAQNELPDVQAAARSFGVRLLILNATTPSEIDMAFTALVGERAGGLVVSSEGFFFTHSAQLVTLAARHAVPAIYSSNETVQAGGLMSYGRYGPDAWRLLGGYAGRVLKGDKPGDLPVQRMTKINLALNLKTAKALGITVPPSILVRADEVIE